MNNSKLYFKEIGLYFVEWNHLFQDSGKWQALVNMVMNTKSNNQLLALVSFVFRDKILKQIHTLKC